MTIYEDQRLELTRQLRACEITYEQWILQTSAAIKTEIGRLEDRICDLHTENHEILSEIAEASEDALEVERESVRLKKLDDWARKYDDLNGRPEGPEDY